MVFRGLESEKLIAVFKNFTIWLGN